MAEAQQLKFLGVVVDDRSGKPIEFATVMLVEDELWAVTAGDGSFEIAGLNPGRRTLTVQALGYKTLKKELREVPGAKMQLRLKADNLSLDEVTVTAHRKQDEATTSYVLDRQTLDNQQIIDLADISSLLPGGKTANGSLLSDSRLALRSGSQEKGNASFGTAIEVDGMRLDNNAVSDETLAAPTRTVSTANVESVEIVTGIPSVEYGDLSNGIVKVRTRKGKSPFIVEGRISQNTRQLAVSKGFDLGHRAGMLNASFERARSFSDPASPYTAYQRNILSLSTRRLFKGARQCVQGQPGTALAAQQVVDNQLAACRGTDLWRPKGRELQQCKQRIHPAIYPFCCRRLLHSPGL